MKALMAGLLAWPIEISVALTAFALLKREESKVIKRRKNKIRT